MNRFICFFLLLCLPFSLFSQEEEQKYTQLTFKSTRIINSHSIETLNKRNLDIRIGHRFGDIAGQFGGWSTLFGIENAADIYIGAEYAILDNLLIGMSRTKGAGPLKQFLNGFVKYRFLRQTLDNKIPLSITGVAGTSWSTMKKSSNPEALNNFSKYAHRFVYVYQLLLGRKFGDAFSLQLHSKYIHRNIVPVGDQNDMVSIGLASRIQISRVFAALIDVDYPFSSLRTFNNGYYFPLGVGLEINTGGHVFTINFTNATAMTEADYLPYSRSNWGDGGFRLGFTISRLFKL